MARAQSITKPKCSLLADPEGFLASPLPSRDTVMKLSRVKTPIGWAYIQRQLEEGAPSSGRLQPAPGHEAGEGSVGWTSAPTYPLSQGFCDQTEQLIYGNPDHRATQQGSGGLPGPSRMTTISAFAAP